MQSSETISSKSFGQLEALGAGLDGDDAKAHRCAEQRRRESHWPLAEHGERVAAADVHAPQRAEGGAGAACDRGAFGEGELLGKLHQRPRRHLQVIGVAAVCRDAVDGDAGAAELRPADAAVLADAAAGIVMVHDALTGGRLALRDAGPARDDDAARLVAGDERVLQIAESESLLRFPGRRAVELQVRAAHARGLHLDHHLARPGRRVGKGAQLDLAIAEEDGAAHA